MGYLLDTNQCIYLMNAIGKPDIKHTTYESNVLRKFNTTTDTMYISILVLAELYYGAINSNQQADNLSRVAKLKLRLNVLDVTEDLARFYADVRMGYPKGETKENFDLMIATTAMFYDFILVSNDKIFEKFKPKIKLENWAV
jgi:tRNA(fMet)-specific endonuclease VapC